jgi:acyl-CoA synthetase (AMP-forming)/AMP-acid ligase II
MDSWFDRAKVPETRFELHYGTRIVRCFADRPDNVHALLSNAVTRRSHGVALICGEESVTYQELDGLVGRTAAGLAARGLRPSDRVALILRNSIEFVVVMFAVARLGAISVPLSIRHQEPENRHIMIDCGAKILVYHDSLADRVPGAGAVPTMEYAIPVRRNEAVRLRLAGMLAPEPCTELTRVPEEATATILYTSGTTGRPKGAMLTHLTRVHSAIHYTTIMQLTDEDRCIVAVPMSHVTGVSAMIDALMHCAGTLIIMPEFNAFDFIDLAVRRRMTFTLMVPAMFNLCLLAPNFVGADLSSWRVSGYGGAIMPEATLVRIAEKLPGLKLINTYGATETTSPAVFMPADQAVARSDCVGLTVPCGHIIVMNENGIELPPNTPGEIYIGGAMVVPGYWANPEATAREFKGGYWKSGDLGSVDEAGYLRVIDRIGDVINRGGYKIFASEVEQVLLDHLSVIEAAVVPKPCPVLGERVHAFVVLGCGETTDDELFRHCASQLADYKVPEGFYRVEATLPRNANGKVLKRELRQRLL